VAFTVALVLAVVVVAARGSAAGGRSNGRDGEGKGGEELETHLENVGRVCLKTEDFERSVDGWVGVVERVSELSVECDAVQVQKFR